MNTQEFSKLSDKEKVEFISKYKKALKADKLAKIKQVVKQWSVVATMVLLLSIIIAEGILFLNIIDSQEKTIRFWQEQARISRSSIICGR